MQKNFLKKCYPSCLKHAKSPPLKEWQVLQDRRTCIWNDRGSKQDWIHVKIHLQINTGVWSVFCCPCSGDDIRDAASSAHPKTGMLSPCSGHPLCELSLCTASAAPLCCSLTALLSSRPPLLSVSCMPQLPQTHPWLCLWTSYSDFTAYSDLSETIPSSSQACRSSQTLHCLSSPNPSTAVSKWLNPLIFHRFFKFVVGQSLSRLWLFSTPWTAARQASLSVIASWSLLKLMSIESIVPPNHLSSLTHFCSCPQSFPASGSFLLVAMVLFHNCIMGRHSNCSILHADLLVFASLALTLPPLHPGWPTSDPITPFPICVFLTVTVVSRKEHLGSIMGGRLTFFIIYLFIVLDCLSNSGCFSLKLSNYKQKY